MEIETRYTINSAKRHIEENLMNLNNQYYPKYHFASPFGWINDPNGFSIYNDELHLFYQYFPYDSQWGPMHWGHAKSKDGIKWEHLEVALAPDKPYDQGGCFSGSAIEKDGKLYLMYTGHLPNEEDEMLTRQNQNIAISEDGITFKKYKHNPVLTEGDIPEGTSITDFRDPKVFEKEGTFYCVIGSKTVHNEGQVLLYKSQDLLKWEFVSVFFPYNKYLGTMVECPDYISIDGKDYFILSAMNYTDEETGEFYSHISWVIEGTVDWKNYVFKMNNIREMDRGLDFYAPQTAKVGDYYIAIAWMQGWKRTFPSHELNHGWAGQMTLPRILEVSDNKLKQKACPNIETYLKNRETRQNLKIDGKHMLSDKPIQYLNMEISSVQLSDFILKFSNMANEYIYLSHSAEERTFYFSREGTKIKIVNDDKKDLSISAKSYPYLEGKVNLKVFIDVSSVEVFINEEITSTNTFYFSEPVSSISIESKNTLYIEKVETANIEL